MPLQEENVNQCNCIAPMITAELLQNLSKVNFVSVIIDASNRKEQKRRRAGHGGGIAPLHFHKRAKGAEVPFQKSHR